MKTNWNEVKKQIDAFRSYVKKMSPAAASTAVHSVLITKEEIEKLLNQKNDGSLLDGIRVYFGGEETDGHLVPNLHTIAVEKDASGNYTDYKIGNQIPQSDTAAFATSMPLTAILVPCPPQCGTKNFLNS